MSLSLFDLSGRTALITGSSQGIGLSIAKGLQNAGAKIILNGRDLTKLTKTSEMLGGTDILAFDVTDHQAVQKNIDEFEKNKGPIDILVNNAGIQYRSPLEDFPTDMFHKIIETNLTSIFNVSQIVGKYMLQRKKGKIINIASVQTSLARPNITPYTASKGAVANLTKGMATEWARHGLQCNAIAPGYFDTPLNADLVNDQTFSQWLSQRTPAGRWGKLEELTGACIFLASDASSFVNGHVLYVDGGITVSL